ncbi:uncharacterized protein LOC106096325 [Stomoxys calcitrans]|uniref:uncharacterized protein LOC106096325 n=1 Tax=Stomoxys calcitrans TaxID=35570 RepID=UPI0027E257CB|nr:uncharacterized protein LOC106096325 [Stomoxys calcitrans]
MASMKYLLALAVVATLANTAFAVHCYQCTSLTNKKCEDTFEPEESMKIDCNKLTPANVLTSFLGVGNHNATGCMKQALETKVSGTYITRSCYFGDISSNNGCKIDVKENPFTSEVACDVCSGNLCNGSSGMAPVVIAIAAFFGLARVLS